MTQKQAKEQSRLQAIERLSKVDISARCAALSLPEPDGGGVLIRCFGSNLRFNIDDCSLVDQESNEPARIADHILVLHYLLCDQPLGENGKLVSFRDFPGGEFYYGPFRSRSLKPLIGRIGNDLDLLAKNLTRFDTESVGMGDLGARVHILGGLYATLIYHKGDEEFSPDANLLFDEVIKQVYPAEDISVIAGRICIGLL